jgi:competence protein ComEC
MKYINSLDILSTKKSWFLFLCFLLIIFSINLYILFNKYTNFISEEIFEADFTILNIYNKKDYDILKLKNSDFIFFTKVNQEEFNKEYILNNNQSSSLKQLHRVNITLLTSNISFFDYLKGFYSNSFNLEIIDNKSKDKNMRYFLYDKINSQHNNIYISQLFNAIFLGINLSTTIRDKISLYGISHLIAISGFHLGLICLFIYIIFYFPYSVIHRIYFPYRNKKFDILVFSIIILFGYLIFTGVIPSLLRAFVMFVVGIYFLRCNIKILSYKTLLIISLLIVSFLPKYMFSLSLWFSICAVFYIFIFLQYFKSLPKIYQFIFFNIWIYLSFNPIVYYFFPIVSFYQILSPIITILFTIFYPIELFLHFIGYGGLLDGFLEFALQLDIFSYEVKSSFLFFYFYIFLSILSIFYKGAFVILNISLVLFNLYIYSLGF